MGRWKGALAAIVAVALALVTYRAWHYCAAPGAPWAYARDIGFDYAVAEYVRHLVHTPTDMIDALAWNPWYDIPQFFYNPLFEYITLAPLAAVVHNVWTAIKLLQVIAIGLAGAGTYALTRTFGRARTWAIFAGLVYALLPLLALNLRAGFSVLWPGVLLPWTFLFGILAIRKYHDRSLPLCALLAAICGTVPSVEFLFVTSIPAYLMLAAYAFDRSPNRRRFAVYAVGSLPLLVGPSLYTILPSLLQTSLAASATRTGATQFPGFLTLFSQTLWESIALVPREQLIDPSLLANSAAFLAVAIPGGALVWGLAYAAARGIFAEPRRVAAWLCAGLVLALVLLSFGPNFAIAIPFWWLLAHLPLVNALRTPDRLLAVPALFLAVGCADGLRLFCTRATGIRNALAVASAAVIFLSFLTFASLSHLWQSEDDTAHVEPHLAAVNAIVQGFDHRTASYAVARGGAFDDGDTYGVPTPSLFSARAFGARFGNDGIGGIGLLSRAGTTTVITTPDWQRSLERYAPNFTALYRAIPLGHTAFDSRDGVYVKALPHPDPMVVGDRLACLKGGPGLIDDLLVLQSMQGTDLLDPGAPCPGVVYSDYAPYDALVPGDATLWEPGAALCPACPRLIDTDATYFVGRYVLNQPWYRNAVDGDTPSFGTHGVALVLGPTGERTFELSLPTLERHAVLAIRFASHAYAYVTASGPGDAHSSVRTFPSHGLRWLLLPLHARLCHAGCQVRLDVRVVPLGIDNMNYTWSGFAIDGIALTSQSTLRALESLGPRGDVAVASSTFGDVFDRAYHATPVKPGLAWTGPSVDAIVVARAPRSSLRGGFTVSLSRARVTEHPESIDAAWSPHAPVRFYAGRITRGDRVLVRGTSRAQTTVIAREPALPFYASGPGKRSADVVFTQGPASLGMVQAIHGFAGYAFTQRGIYGRSGAWVRMHIVANGVPTLYSVGAEDVRGRGTIQTALVCGRRIATQITSRTYVRTVLTLRSPAPSCDLYAKWLGNASLGRIYVRSKALAPTWERRTLWLPAGHYRATAVQANWRKPAIPFAVEVDGIRLTGATLALHSSGYHHLAVRSGGGAPWLLTFGPAHPRRARFAPIHLRQTAGLRDSIKLTESESLKVNHLDDGYWVLSGNKRTLRGSPCNIVSTCFTNVPAGAYALRHRWPPYSTLGFGLTFASIALAFVPLLGIRPRRPPLVADATEHDATEPRAAR